MGFTEEEYQQWLSERSEKECDLLIKAHECLEPLIGWMCDRTETPAESIAAMLLGIIAVHRIVMEDKKESENIVKLRKDLLEESFNMGRRFFNVIEYVDDKIKEERANG
jgi:hypothetical protein